MDRKITIGLNIDNEDSYLRLNSDEIIKLIIEKLIEDYPELEEYFNDIDIIATPEKLDEIVPDDWRISSQSVYVPTLLNDEVLLKNFLDNQKGNFF